MRSPSATTSIMKNAGSRIGQGALELLVEMMGTQGVGWEGEGFSQRRARHCARLARRQATTIYGAAPNPKQHHRQRILGLLDHQ